MKKKYGTILVVAVALAFLVVGLLQGQNHDVFVKAVKICLECIGIG